MKLTAIQGHNCKNFIVISDLTTKQDFELYDIIKNVLYRKEFFPGFGKSPGKWVHQSFLFQDYVFPVQFWHDVKTMLKKFIGNVVLENEEILYQTDINREDFDEWIKTLKFPEKYVLDKEEYKFQQDSVFLAIQNKIGRIEITMSGGKTFITYLYCRYLFEFILDKCEEKKILVVVPSKSLAIQLKNDFKDYDTFFGRKLFVENIFSGAKQLLNADVICGTYQSLGNYDQEYFDIFGAFICDELHKAKAYTIENEIYAKVLKSEYFFGMTGTTPPYKSLDYLHITAMFGRELVKVTAKQAIDSGISTPIKIHIIKIHYDEDNNFSENLKEQGIIGTEKYRMEKYYFQNNQNRTKLIGKLLTKLIGNSLILVDTVEYCFKLKEFLSEFCKEWQFEVIYGDIPIEEREIILNGIKSAKSNFCLIGTYGTLSTGISINNLENIYFPDGGKSEIRIRQSLGRGMRLFPTKEYCNVFDLQDMMRFSSFLNHSKERLRIYKEQQFPYKITEITI